MSKKKENNKGENKKNKTRFWSKAGKAVKTVGGIALAIIPLAITIISKFNSSLNL